MGRTPCLVALIAASACGRGRFEELSDAGTVDALVLASSFQITAMANLFGAGHAVPPAPGGSGAGSLPPEIALPAGRGRVLTLTNIAGVIDFGVGQTTADGAAGTNQPSSYGGLADLTCQRHNALEGVFLDDSEPTDPAPPNLSVDVSAASITGIGLRQFFFVGDGLTGGGSGELQTFLVPDAATRLYLGFADAAGGGLLPGSYQDNTGTLTVGTAQLQTP